MNPLVDDILNYDTATSIWSIAQITDSLAVLDNEKDFKIYSVTFAYQYGDELVFPRGEETVDFTVEFKNPCIDEDYVSIGQVALSPISASIGDPNAVTE